MHWAVGQAKNESVSLDRGRSYRHITPCEVESHSLERTSAFCSLFAWEDLGEQAGSKRGASGVQLVKMASACGLLLLLCFSSLLYISVFSLKALPDLPSNSGSGD